MGPRRLRGLARGSDLFVHERLLGLASFYDWCARHDNITELVTTARTISCSGWNPGRSGRGMGEGVEHADAVLGGGGQVRADGAEVLCAGH